VQVVLFDDLRKRLFDEEAQEVAAVSAKAGGGEEAKISRRPSTAAPAPQEPKVGSDALPLRGHSLRKVGPAGVMT
jgi:hypothetical protein